MKGTRAWLLIEFYGNLSQNLEGFFCNPFKDKDGNMKMGAATMFAATGKSFSEALIFASTNQQYDDRLFIELLVKYMKTASSEHVVYINWFFGGVLF